MDNKEINDNLSRIYNELQKIRLELESFSNEDGYDNLNYAAGSISDAISEVSDAYNANVPKTTTP